jgi:hypothetical protein
MKENEPIRLNFRQWQIVQDKCCSCIFWNYFLGCLWRVSRGEIGDEFPQETCDVKEEIDKP